MPSTEGIKSQTWNKGSAFKGSDSNYGMSILKDSVYVE